MPVMTLGGQSFATDPKIQGSPDVPVRISASVETLTSVAFFSWGTTRIGKTFPILWDFLNETDFQKLVTLLNADAAVTFYTGVESITVQMLNVESSYIEDVYKSVTVAGGRKDVKVPLLIIGV